MYNLQASVGAVRLNGKQWKWYNKMRTCGSGALMVKWKFVALKRQTKGTCFLHLLLHISHVICFAVFIFPFTDMLLFAHSLTALLYTTDSNFIPYSLLSTLMMEAECGYLATRLHNVMSEKTDL